MDEHLLRFDKEKQFIFIDCETENLCLNNTHNLPWQIAMLKTVNGQKIAEKNFLVSYDRELHVGAKAAEITRFNPVDHAKASVPFKDIFPTVRDWLNSADYIVGHNILGFDIYLIKGMYESRGEDYTPIVNKIIDTMCLVRGLKLGIEYKPELESLLEYQYKVMHLKKKGIKSNLLAVGKEYNIEHNYDLLHEAINDLELNLKVWNKLKWQVSI